MAAVSLLCLGTMLISCDKTPGKSDVVGTWSLISTDYYFDDEKIVFDSFNDALYWLYEDGTTDCVTPLQSAIGGMILSINFNEDGGIYLFGEKLADWDYSNGQVIVKGDEQSAQFGYLSGGNLFLDSSEQVLGYQVIKDFDYDNPTDNWIGSDGTLHTLKTCYMFSK